MRLTLLALLLFAAPGDFAIDDPVEFNKILAADSDRLKPATGFQFVEGPVYTQAGGGFLVFSDINANQLKSWTSSGGAVVFRDPSGNANGNTRDVAGRLITCEHGNRRVSRTETNGTVVDLALTSGGGKFNSPNDVVVKSDGTIWFTDPDYGLAGRPKEQAGNYVYRLDAGAAPDQAVAVVTNFVQPNGLCLSPDETKLYISDSDGTRHHIRVFGVSAANALSDQGVFATITPGAPDGIRCDRDGRVFSSAGNGVQVFLPTGTRIGTILVPETPTNCGFGGADGQTLFITAQTSLYTIHLGVTGSGVASGAPVSAGGGGGGGDGGGCGATGLEALLILALLAARRGVRSSPA